MFHIQTRAHYFMQTLLAGGATYRATGRGFVTTHNAFDEQYRRRRPRTSSDDSRRRRGSRV